MGRYRFQQPGLFPRTDQAIVPSRIPGAPGLAREAGPTKRHVSVSQSASGAVTAWPWDREYGDWIDANGERWGSVPFNTVKLNAVSGSDKAADYSFDVTALVKAAEGRWLAALLRCPGAPRTIAGRFSASGLPDNPGRPQIAVTYADGSKAVLDCLVVAALGNDQPNTTAPTMNLPVMLEFERPTALVVSASMSLYVTAHWSGSDTTAQLFLLDPPVVVAPVEQGIAAAAALDAGLVGHPDIIGVHRYVDDSALGDFIFTGNGPAGSGWNVGAERDFDPAIWGTGPTNTNLLPHAGLGKWINADRKDLSFTLVKSTHTGDGFQALAPGMGAIRVTLPKQAKADGDVVGYTGTLGVNAKIFLPEPLFGRLRRIFVRQYVRIATPDGAPYETDQPGSLQVRQTAGGPVTWTGAGGGKCFVMPAHDCPGGGVSGSSGGGHGWQMREGWNDSDFPGPETGGWTVAPHFYDYGNNNPVGFRYGGPNSPSGGKVPQGGLGSLLLAHQWYCFETELFLNTIMSESPGFVADGYMRQWLDGRLVYEATGMVTRSLPLVNPAFNPLSLRPVRELGIRDLWWNWFHGGQVQSTRDRVMFMTGLAWGHSYIGPMKVV